MTTGRPLTQFLIVSMMVCMSGCAALSSVEPAFNSPHQPQPGLQSNTVYLIRHGWHTALAVRVAEISIDDWPESAAFQGMHFVEVGWGDKGFYQADFMGPLVVANAAFLPSRSALHVAGIEGPLEEFFPESQIIEIQITPQAMRGLCRFIHESYAHDVDLTPQYLAPALYGSGGLYLGSALYFVPKTCNVWTAQALAAAGCPIVVPLCTAAQGVVIQSHRFGRVIQKKSNVLPVIYPFINFDRPAK